MSSLQVCELVYRRNRVILFGLDIGHEEDGEIAREVLLYPKGRIIHATDVGLGIAKDLDTAEEVSNFHFGTHHHCLHWQKFYCMDCLQTRFFPNHRHKSKDAEFLQIVKEGKDFNLDLESNGASIDQQDCTSSMLMEMQERINNWELPKPAGSKSLIDEDTSIQQCKHVLNSIAIGKQPELSNHHVQRLITHVASMSDLPQYSEDKIDSEVRPQESIEVSHELQETTRKGKLGRYLSHLGRGEISQNHPRGLRSHLSMTRGRHHDQSHVHVHGLISYASMSNLRAFSKEETPEIEAQALLRKGVRKHQDPGPSLLMPDMDNKHCNTLDMPKKTKRFVITLEDAIDMAMSWPPLQILDKPDPSIIERRRAEVYKSLKTSTLNVVKLSHPHILVCIQGKWPSSLFYFVSQLRTPGMPNPPIVILHPNEPSIADWGCVGVFQHIYFVIGSPSYELDLLRAGVLQAGAAIHSSFQLFQ
jgi:hypothetical protein